MSKLFFEKDKGFVIGMVHCLPLPGTKDFDNNMEKIREQALQDALTLEKAGVDAIIVENMGDNPLPAALDMEQVTALAAISMLVKEHVSIPVGIDAAFNDYKADLAIAKAIGAAFIRIPVFVDTVMYYNGTIEPCARAAMIYRKQLQAEDVKIFADVQVKHTYMVNDKISIEASAKQAAGVGADAIIVTGTSIGEETPLDLIKRVKKAVNIPVMAGSGVNVKNIKSQFEVADGAIVGTSLKANGDIRKPISFELTKALIEERDKEVNQS